MPFVQMENISHFLRACQMPPLNLPPHDVFLTVDLYEAKDPAQVLQCIGAFSRRANAINPSAFPRAIGVKGKGAAMSPQLSGSNQTAYSKPLSGLETRARGASNVSDTSPTTWNPLAKGSYSGRISPTKPSSLATGGLAPQTGQVSSWSKRDDEGNTAPAWNIHQYGYMGGASQGNQGVSFGARRQITSAAPSVPSLADKERRRKEEQAEAERRRLAAEEADQRRRQEIEAEEQRARLEEEQRWEEETKRLKERERRQVEEEKRRWDEEQRRWKEEEESRLREERDLESQLAAERKRQRETGDARLNGQFLSQYQASQNQQGSSTSETAISTSESQRIKELERQLEEAKERERQYERERQERLQNGRQRLGDEAPLSTPQAISRRPPEPSQEDAFGEAERESLRKEWVNYQGASQPQAPPQPPRPQPAEPASAQIETPPPQPPRPTLPTPIQAQEKTSTPSRPLPNPAAYTPGANRTDRFLSSNPAPAPIQPVSHRPADYSTTTEVDLENERRKESQAGTKAGGWASKSLLEREMERERERQREWEEGQKQMAQAARDPTQGHGPGQTWDVHQYGYMGGDNQNRVGPGLGIGGARRQIIGPRPLESSKK
jgi:transgelin